MTLRYYCERNFEFKLNHASEIKKMAVISKLRKKRTTYIEGYFSFFISHGIKFELEILRAIVTHGLACRDCFPKSSLKISKYDVIKVSRT